MNMGSVDPTLASKSLDLCQALISQGKDFTFSLTYTGTSCTFSLDTRGKDTSREKVKTSTTVARKKMSPLTKKRNENRREEFLKKKHSASTDPVDSPGKTVEAGSKENTTENSEVAKEPTEVLETPVQKPPATQPWRRPSSCRRCHSGLPTCRRCHSGLPTRGHPGPYDEERCRVSLPHLPSIRILKCSSCDTHRKHWT